MNSNFFASSLLGLEVKIALGTAKELGSNLTRPVFSTEIVRLKNIVG